LIWKLNQIKNNILTPKCRDILYDFCLSVDTYIFASVISVFQLSKRIINANNSENNAGVRLRFIKKVYYLVGIY